MTIAARPKVSVIIPVYNVEQYVRECLESFCSQTYANIEAIVVNDGSIDSSLCICREIAKRDSRIRVIDQKNQGVVIARQVGVNASVGEYLLFLDADDYLRCDCIEKIVAVLDTYRPDVVVYGDYTRTCDTIKKNELLYEEGLYDRENIVKEIYPSIIQTKDCKYFSPSVICKVFNRLLYMEYQLTGTRVMIGEDMACTVSCICNANSLYILGESLYYYRYNPASVTASRKAFDWDCAEKITQHLSRKIDLTEYDLQMQLYRYVTHMLFTTACSQFNIKASDGQIRKDIVEHLRYPYYAIAVNRSRFKVFSKGWFARLVLKYKLIWIMKLYQRCLK